MTSGWKIPTRVAVPVLALLVLLTLGADAARAAQRKAQPTGEPPAARTPVARSSSSGSTGTATRSATSRSDTGRKAVQTRRSTPATRSRDHGSRGYRSHGGHHLGLYFGYYGYYGPGSYWGPYYHYPYHYYPFYWGAPYYVPRRARTEYDLGALDLNVRPKRAEVYLDGQYIGPVREFDGWPGYLWLEGGSYELIFYRPGYSTEVRTFTVYPGVVVDVRLQMHPGEALAPDQLSKAARRGPVEEARSAYRAEARERAPAAPVGGERAELDTRATPGRLRLSVLPADSSVYLDGRFLGSGEELGQLHAGLVVDAGSHLLEVVRPGYGSKRVEFSVEEGSEVQLEVLLETG